MFSRLWRSYCVARDDCLTLAEPDLHQAAERESAAILALANEPSPDLSCVSQKMSVLASIVAIGGNWLDHRDALLVASVAADLLRLTDLLT